MLTLSWVMMPWDWMGMVTIRSDTRRRTSLRGGIRVRRGPPPPPQAKQPPPLVLLNDPDRQRQPTQDQHDQHHDDDCQRGHLHPLLFAHAATASSGSLPR